MQIEKGSSGLANHYIFSLRNIPNIIQRMNDFAKCFLLLFHQVVFITRLIFARLGVNFIRNKFDDQTNGYVDLVTALQTNLTVSPSATYLLLISVNLADLSVTRTREALRFPYMTTYQQNSFSLKKFALKVFSLT